MELFIFLLYTLINSTCVFAIAKRLCEPKSINGFLKVRYDEDEPYLYLQLSQTDMDNIHKNNYVVLKVDITR